MLTVLFSIVLGVFIGFVTTLMFSTLFDFTDCFGRMLGIGGCMCISAAAFIFLGPLGPQNLVFVFSFLVSYLTFLCIFET